MAINYCNFSNFDPKLEHQFETYWQHFHKEQSLIQHIYQNENNNRAAVFNIWINLLHQVDYLVVKPEKMILHAFDELLLQKIRGFVGFRLDHFFEQHEKCNYVIFVYAYVLTSEIIQEIERFCALNPEANVQRLVNYPYYYLSDSDLPEDAEIYRIMKVLIADFVHGYLSRKIVNNMHNEAIMKVSELTKANDL